MCVTRRRYIIRNITGVQMRGERGEKGGGEWRSYIKYTLQSIMNSSTYYIKPEIAYRIEIYSYCYLTLLFIFNFFHGTELNVGFHFAESQLPLQR